MPVSINGNGAMSGVTATSSGIFPNSATATVATQQTTTSTSYTDLATVGPAVTLTTGTKALVIVTSKNYSDASGSDVLTSFAVSGATTIAASDAWAFDSVGSAAQDQTRSSAMRLVTGLTPGSNTFTVKYRVFSGTGQFALRDIIVIDMGS